MKTPTTEEVQMAENMIRQIGSNIYSMEEVVGNLETSIDNLKNSIQSERNKRQEFQKILNQHKTTNDPDKFINMVDLYLKDNQKINAIKYTRECLGLSLYNAKKIIDFCINNGTDRFLTAITTNNMERFINQI